MTLRQVMIIDDSDADLLYTRIVLEATQVAEEVLSFETAVEALSFLEAPGGHEVEMILLDINMPEMDGFAFLQAYEQLHASHRARAVVVMVTSSPADADRERALQFECVKGYVVKPIEDVAARALASLQVGADHPG